MSKKLVSALALLMALVLLLCACGGDGGEKKDDPVPTTAPSIPTDPTDPTADPGSDGPSKPEDPTDPVDPPVPPEEKPYMTPAQALYGASANGYGIWSVSTGLSTVKRVCVDTDGFVAFEMDSSETDVAGVYHDAVLLKVNYDYYILRAVPSGEMLFDSSSADGAKIILPEHNGKEMFREGYILVVKPVESYNGVTYEMGVLNSNGEWISPISADFPMLSYMNGMTVDQMEKEIVYLGEGVLGLRCSNDKFRYFNMNTNSVKTAQFPNNLSKHTLYDALDYDVHFISGVSDPVYMNNNYYLFYDNGKIEEFKVLWPKGLPRSEKCGDPYFDRKSKTAYFLYDYGDGILVANSEGKIIKKQEGVDLKEYSYLTATRFGCHGFAADGYARIIIENSEGTAYYTVLGIDGEFLFQPVQLNERINRVFDPDGYNIEVNTAAGYGYFAVVDNDGTICYESDYVSDFSVKNGVLHFKEDNEKFYIRIEVPALY